MVLAIIVLVELEDGFSCSLAEPDDGIDFLLTRPFYFPDDPRRADASEIRGRREVDVEHGVRVLLKIRRGHVRIGFSFHRPLDDRGLVLARRDERDLPRFHDRGHAHRDRFRGHVVLAEEIAGGVATGDRVERNTTGAGVSAGARLIEADVPRLADAENLQVYPAGSFDRGLVRLTFDIDVVARK